MVEQAFNPSTQEVDLYEFEACLVDLATYRTARGTKRNPFLKTKNKQ